MRQKMNLAPGWLRDEIGSALVEVKQKSYISEQWKKSFESAATTIERSDRIGRPTNETTRRAVRKD